MARNTNAKSDALATTGGDSLAVDEAASLAELTDFFDEVGGLGLEDVGGEDVKLAVKLWNMKGLDKSGRSYPRDVFFDTVSESTADEIDAVLLLTTKTKRYDEFDNALDKTVVHCASDDRITGEMKDGALRPCKGCPDDGWFRGPDGKPFRKCGEIHNVVAVERLTGKPFAVRFKKTALKAFRQYVMAHHWNARKAADGSRAHVPLFAYQVTMGLKMHESGKYALPVLTRGPMLPRTDALALASVARDFLDNMGAILRTAESQSEKHSTADRDDNISSDDFVG